MSLSLTHFNVITPLILLLTFFSAFKNGKMTCDNYLRNTFLYILSIYCVFISSMSIEKEYNISSSVSFIITLILFIMALSALYFSKNVLIRHICLFYIVFYIGITSYDFITRFDEELIYDTIYRVLIALVLCIFISYKYGHLLKDGGYKYLVYLLLITVIISIIDFIFISKKQNIIYSYIFIVLFLGFLLYDIKFIFKRKGSCNSSNVDYIDGSLDIFLDTLNLFKNGLIIMEE